MTSGGFRITRPDSDQLLSETADKITQIFLKNIEAVKVRRRLHDSYVKKPVRLISANYAAVYLTELGNPNRKPSSVFPQDNNSKSNAQHYAPFFDQIIGVRMK